MSCKVIYENNHYCVIDKNTNELLGQFKNKIEAFSFCQKLNDLDSIKEENDINNQSAKKINTFKRQFNIFPKNFLQDIDYKKKAQEYLTLTKELKKLHLEHNANNKEKYSYFNRYNELAKKINFLVEELDLSDLYYINLLKYNLFFVENKSNLNKVMNNAKNNVDQLLLDTQLYKDSNKYKLENKQVYGNYLRTIKDYNNSNYPQQLNNKNNFNNDRTQPKILDVENTNKNISNLMTAKNTLNYHTIHETVPKVYNQKSYVHGNNPYIKQSDINPKLVASDYFSNYKESYPFYVIHKYSHKYDKGNWIKKWLSIFQILTLLSLLFILFIPIFNIDARPIFHYDTLNVNEATNTFKAGHKEGEAIFNIKFSHGFIKKYKDNISAKIDKCDEKFIKTFNNNNTRLTLTLNTADIRGGTYKLVFTNPYDPYFVNTTVDFKISRPDYLILDLPKDKNELYSNIPSSSAVFNVDFSPGFRPAKGDIKITFPNITNMHYQFSDDLKTLTITGDEKDSPSPGTYSFFAEDDKDGEAFDNEKIYYVTVKAPQTVQLNEVSNNLKAEVGGTAEFNVKAENGFSLDLNLKYLGIKFDDNVIFEDLTWKFNIDENNHFLGKLKFISKGNINPGTYNFKVTCLNKKYFYYKPETPLYVMKDIVYQFTMGDTHNKLVAETSGLSMKIDVTLGKNFNPSDDQIHFSIFDHKHKEDVFNLKCIYDSRDKYVLINEIDEKLNFGSYCIYATYSGPINKGNTFSSNFKWFDVAKKDQTLILSKPDEKFIAYTPKTINYWVAYDSIINAIDLAKIGWTISGDSGNISIKYVKDNYSIYGCFSISINEHVAPGAYPLLASYKVDPNINLKFDYYNQVSVIPNSS